MSEAQTVPNVLTLDGVQYEVDKFGPVLQQAITVYNRFTADLKEQELEVFKTKSALAHLSSQIAGAVKEEQTPVDSETTEE